MDQFTKAYIEAAFFTFDENTEKVYGIDDLSHETKNAIIKDCQRFQVENSHLIIDDYLQNNSEPEIQAGHDFWLTRNHHGAGFWDGEWSKNVGELLTQNAHKYGEFNLYIGIDNKIYHL